MRYIIKELRRHLLRTIFVTGGYAIASVFILLLLCMNGSGKNDSLGVLQSTGTHFIAYIPTSERICTSSITDGSVYAEGVMTMMLDNSLLRTIKNVKGVKDAAPCLFYKMFSDSYGTEISIAGIDTLSIATSSTSCSRTSLIAGRYLSGKPDELVAEQSFARAHQLKPGDTLQVFGGKMVLAGVVNSGIKPVKADFYAPIEFVREVLKEKLKCSAPHFDMNIILVEVADSRLQDDVIARVKNMMYKFTVSTYNCYEPAYKVMSIIDRTSTGITALIFVFMVFFSAKTQLASLMERFREIGILKSLGWSDSKLGFQTLLISLLQSITGVSLGLLIGFFIISLLDSSGFKLFEYITFSFRYSSIVILYTLAIGGALLAGIFPVVRICRAKAGDIIKNNL